MNVMAETSPGYAPNTIVVCVKWVATHVHIDPLSGVVAERSHDNQFSASDHAAVEVALRTARAWNDAGSPTQVVAVCVGPVDSEDELKVLIADGVDRAIRVEAATHYSATSQPTSRQIASLICAVIGEMTSGGQLLVVCGDVSADRGSGSVPAFIAHEIGCAQALGLVEVHEGDPGVLRAMRRLDGGRREELVIEAPAVISVEGAVAHLRRASLQTTIAARSATVELRNAREIGAAEPAIATSGLGDGMVMHPWRPRTRIVPAPVQPDALGRIVELTGAKSDRVPPRTVTLEPDEAARAILDQLAEWGYEWGQDSPI